MTDVGVRGLLGYKEFYVVLSEIYRVFVVGLGVSAFHSPPGADHMMSGPGGLEDTATPSVLLV